MTINQGAWLTLTVKIENHVWFWWITLNNSITLSITWITMKTAICDISWVWYMKITHIISACTVQFICFSFCPVVVFSYETKNLNQKIDLKVLQHDRYMVFLPFYLNNLNSFSIMWICTNGGQIILLHIHPCTSCHLDV